MMGERDDELLRRTLAGESTRAEDPAVRARMAEPRTLQALLRGAREDAFAPGFAGRVARRARAEYARGPLSAALLERYFVRLVPAALAAMLLLAGYTLLGARPGQGGVEALLGLAPVTAEVLLAADPPGS